MDEFPERTHHTSSASGANLILSETVDWANDTANNIVEPFDLLPEDTTATTTSTTDDDSIAAAATEDDSFLNFSSSSGSDSGSNNNNNSILQPESSRCSTNTTTSSSSGDDSNDSQILRNTFRVYGSLLLIFFIAFCWIRRKFPKAYNLRKEKNEEDPEYSHLASHNAPELHTHLAEKRYGFFSWLWKLASIDDQTFMDECGMDAWCFIRICRMGFRMTWMGMFVSIWLLPAYSTAQEPCIARGSQDDPVAELTTANLPNGSSRLIATVLAAYVVFFDTMYMIMQEMKVFTTMRHKFLQKPRPRNYAVYLRNIPEGFQSNIGMTKFFEKSIQGLKVKEAHICLVANNLQEQTDKRAETIRLLEHAVVEKDQTGQAPTHKVDKGLLPIGLPVGSNDNEEVDSISYYAQELKQMNKEITDQIEQLEEIANQQPNNAEFEVDMEERHAQANDDDLKNFLKRNTTEVVTDVVKTPLAVKNEATNLVTKATSKAGDLVGLSDNDDGKVLSAGFVVFHKLSTANAALQMIHHEEPYAMEVTEAPDPDDIFWENVGRKHKDLEIGRLISLGATASICLFWTLPVGFVASISTVKGLRDEFAFLDGLLANAPILIPILEILAPQFLVILDTLRPVILSYVTTFEGAVSGSLLEASLFVKLSAFMIIQTFFITALSSSILQELRSIVRSPGQVVGILAETLPAKSTFFMQLAFVRTTTTFLVEGMGVIRLGKAMARRYVGPKLTIREQKMSVYGLNPLSVPPDFAHSDYLANLVLLYMVYLVYAVIAPLVSYIVGFCFVIQGALFRHQFVYIYRAKPDSGGMLYLNFIKLLTIFLVVAQVTICGLMALKQGVYAVPLMIPLIVVTLLFSIYIRGKHFSVATRLPTRLCLQGDLKTEHHSFLKNAYLQPEMCYKKAFPRVPRQSLDELGFGYGDEEEVVDTSRSSSDSDQLPPATTQERVRSKQSNEPRDITEHHLQEIHRAMKHEDSTGVSSETSAPESDAQFYARVLKEMTSLIP